MHKIKLYNLSLLFIIGIIVSIFSSITSMLLPLFTKDIIDMNFMGKQVQYNKIIYIIFILIFFGSIFNSISGFLISISGDRTVKNTRYMLQKHIINLPISYFNENYSGKIASRIVNDTNTIKSFITNIIPSFINSLLILFGTLCIMLIMDVKLSLLLIILFLLNSLSSIPIGKINKKYSSLFQKYIGSLFNISSEIIHNIKTIKLNNANSYFLNKFSKYNNDVYKVSKKEDILNAICSPIQETITVISILFIIIYGIDRIHDGSLSSGTLISFLIYLFQIINPINTVINFYNRYNQAKGSIKEITSIMSKKVEISYILSDKPLYKNKDLMLKNITFSYNNDIILKDITMKFDSNKNIAIVGPSGVGKSTIINIITRLYPLTNGKILLGEKDSKNFGLYEWRNLFAVVTQSNQIISGTIYDNLLLGLKTSPSFPEIWNSLKIANMYNYVIKLKRGLFENVGEDGVKLSGGQKQRIGIARAYLKGAPFLILDEATSNLDPDSEVNVISSIKSIKKHFTLITIAHRLSTIIDSDKIYFVNNKKICGYGNHKELFNKLPEYKRFVTEQLINHSVRK